jgi:hydrogenase-4 component E
VNGTEIVNSLAGPLIVTSVLVIEAKRPSRAALLYSLQSGVLVSVFVALAVLTGKGQLYLWALSAFATKVVLVPSILYRAPRRFDESGRCRA